MRSPGVSVKVKVKVIQSCLILCNPMDYTGHGILQARILEWVAFPFSRDLPNQGIKPRSPALWANSSPAEPQGKPKITGVGSLSLLQRIFLTQESNQVSCIAGGFFTNWAIREALFYFSISISIYMYNTILILSFNLLFMYFLKC